MRRADVWIAGIDALVVLALATTLLVLVGLGVVRRRARGARPTVATRSWCCGRPAAGGGRAGGGDRPARVLVAGAAPRSPHPGASSTTAPEPARQRLDRRRPEREHRGVGFRFTTRAGHPTFVDLPWEQPLAEWDTDRLVVAGARHLPPRRALRRLRARRLRPEGAARPAGRAASTGCCASSTSGRCRWSRRSASPPGARRRRRAARRRAHHAPPPVLAAVPGAVQPGDAGRPVGAAARRPRPAAGPGPPGRVLLGRLLAVEHAVPPGRGGAGRLAGRRRDGRAARPPVRRPARPRPRHRRDERGRRAARHRRPPVRDVGRRPPCADDDPRIEPAAVAEDLRRRYDGPVARADHRRGVRGGGGVARRRAGAPAQRARVRRRRDGAGRRPEPTPAGTCCASPPTSSSPATTAAGCCSSPASTCRRTRPGAC